MYWVSIMRRGNNAAHSREPVFVPSGPRIVPIKCMSLIG